MAVVPPTYANGTVSNNSQYKPIPWDQIPASNHSTIGLSNMPYSSTVEYKGYYKPQSTGLHTFSATGSEGITAYAWVSGAPRDSSRIKVNEQVRVTNDRSYGIIIPNPRGTGTWRFEDSNVVGQFPGYGYWPKTGYGGSQMPSKFNTMYGGNNTPNTECGYVQTAHQTWLPGDIRTYDTDWPGNNNKTAGPGWQGPEEEHFHSPCWDNGTRTSFPLIRLSNTKGLPSDAGTNNRSMGKTNQVFLDVTFKAEGNDRINWGKWQVVHTNPNDSNEKFVWLQSVDGIRQTGQGKRDPERIHIQFSLKFKVADTYTFEIKTRDGLKLWHVTKDFAVSGDARTARKLEPTTGKNPLNRDSGNTSETGWAPNSWDSSAQDYGEMTYEQEFAAEDYIRFIGYGVGIPSSNTHGFSITVKDSSGAVVWTTDKLTVDPELNIGIDECGFNALLTDNDRLLGDQFRDTESFKDDGWQGNTGELFTADFRQGDDETRGLFDTRQYLPTNSLTRCRGGQSIQGSIWLRGGDYYFIRVIVSNHINDNNNFDFRVRTPTNVTQTVEFTGNGNPGSDSSVGGDAGSGNKINTEILCNSTLYSQGKNSNDLNFAFVNRPSVGQLVLNLSGGSLDVPTNKIGLEGQQGLVDGSVVQAAGVTLTLAAGTDVEATVTLSKLLRGGSDGISEMSSAQIAAAREEYRIQRSSGDVLNFGDFRNAITSKAVIQWGESGNYKYVYHSVADVIRAICDPDDPLTGAGAGANITAADNSKTQTTATGTESTCIDIDFTNLGEGFSQIASECLDDCKTPAQFPVPTYSINNSDYAGFVNAWRPMIKLKKDYGWQRTWVDRNPSDQPVPAVSIIAGSSGSPIGGGAGGGAAYFRPGEITVVPLFIPDVFYDDTLNWTGPIKETTDEKYGDVYCGEIGIDFSSNHFTWNPDGSTEAGNPWMVVWISAFPGGPPLANPNGSDYQSRGFHVYSAQAGTKAYSQIWYTAIYERWEASQDSDSQWYQRYSGYLGNMYGARYLNLVSMKEELKDTYNFAIPEVGTQAFIDLMSEKGGKTNELRTKGVMPIADCDTVTNAPGDAQTYDDRYDFLG